MFRSKAVEILKSLSKEEFKRLGKFLNSPFFNTNKNLIKLYKVLKKHYPDFNEIKFTKGFVYKGIYKSTYDDENLKKLFSELLKELNKFLAVLSFEEDRPVYNRLLLNKLQVKKLDQLFYKKFSEANELLENSGLNYSYFFYLEKFLLQWEYVTFHLIRDEQLKIAPNILERADYLTFFFLSDLFLTLRDIDANWTRFGYLPEKNLPKTFLDNFNIDNFLKYIEDNNYLHKEVIRIYYTAYLAYTKFDDESHYHNLDKLISSYWNKLSKNVKHEVIFPLINYCIKKIESGSYKFGQNLFDLFKRYMDSKLYELEEYIRTDYFLCLIDNFSIYGKILEAKEFLESNMNGFHPEHRDNLKLYIDALMYFEVKKYGDALNKLAHIKTDTFLFKKRMKKLSLKIYYEMGLYDEAIGNANNYKMFLLNKKNAPGQWQEKSLKFLHYYNQILKLRFEKNDNFAVEEIKKSLNESGACEEQFWIEEKIKEFVTQNVHLPA